MEELTKDEKAFFKISFVISWVMSGILYSIGVGLSYLMTFIYPNVSIWIGGLILFTVYITYLNAKHVAIIAVIKHLESKRDDKDQ